MPPAPVTRSPNRGPARSRASDSSAAGRGPGRGPGHPHVGAAGLRSQAPGNNPGGARRRLGGELLPRLNHPDQSLLTLATDLGFNALAFDQPGYAASAGRVEHLDLPARADLLAGSLTEALGSHDWGDGVVLVAHSLGSQVAAELATRKSWVIGLEISGTGLERNAALSASLPAFLVDRSKETRRRTFAAIWGGPGFYPEGTLSRDMTRGSPSPGFELDEALTWPKRLPGAVAAIPVPVHLTAAEHEASGR